MAGYTFPLKFPLLSMSVAAGKEGWKMQFCLHLKIQLRQAAVNNKTSVFVFYTVKHITAFL